MNNKVYGYITGSARFIKTGSTLRGAKIACSRAGHSVVGYRFGEVGGFFRSCVKDSLQGWIS